MNTIVGIVMAVIAVIAGGISVWMEYGPDKKEKGNEDEKN